MLMRASGDRAMWSGGVGGPGLVFWDGVGGGVMVWMAGSGISWGGSWVGGEGALLGGEGGEVVARTKGILEEELPSEVVGGRGRFWSGLVPLELVIVMTSWMD